MKTTGNTLVSPVRMSCWRMLALLMITLLPLPRGQAALLFHEGFDYPEGQELADPAGSPTWENDKSQFTIGAGSLEHTGIQESTGNRLYVEDASPSYDGVRTGDGAWTGQSSGSLYVSFLLRVESTLEIVSTGEGTSILTIGRDSNSSQMFGVSLLNSGGIKLGIVKYPGGPTSPGYAFFSSGAGADLSANGSTVYLVVAKYEYVGGTGNDVATVWINPDTSLGTEDPANRVSVGTGTDGTRPLERLTLCRGPNVSIDEIRIGQTWAEVTPTGGPLVASRLSFGNVQQVSFVGETLHPVVVNVLNAGGVLVPTNGVPVTLALTAGSGALNGTLTRTTGPDGRAVFADLRFDTLGSGKEITATGGGLDPGVVADLWVIRDPDGVAAVPPVITQAVASAGGLILRGEGGAPDGAYELERALAVTTAADAWPALATNTFDDTGGFACTNAMADAHSFFRLDAQGGDGGVFRHMGYASVPGPVTGGGTGTNVVVVNDLPGFTAATSGLEPRIVYVDGTITLRENGNTYLHGNKTIIGLGTHATLVGNLGIFYEEGGTTYAATNIVLRNLHITNPDGYGEDDAITIKYGGRQVWIDHCTFYDTPDGLVDATREADFVTVSWCRFYYTGPGSHNNVNLIGGSDDDTGDLGKLHLTFHHNWYGPYCVERMPSVRFGRMHFYNNFLECAGNNYCTRTRLYAEVLVENNHYEGVYNPWELATSTAGPNGLLHASGNITNGCIFGTSHYDPGLPNSGVVVLVDGSDTLTPAATDPIGLNPPPYGYTLDDAADVQSLVTTHAGAGRGPFAP